MAIFASTTTSGYGDPMKAMTIKALEQRQRDVLAQQAEQAAKAFTPENTQTPIQGLAQVANTAVDAMRQKRVDEAVAAQRDAFAKNLAGVDWEKGPTSQQIAGMSSDPETLRAVMQMLAENRRTFRGQDVQVRGQDVGAQTATRGQDVQVRGQDVGAQTAARGQDVQVRGQDVGAQTATRGQDVTAQTATRGQDIGAQTATRGQDVQVRGQDVAAQTATRGQDIGAQTATRGQDVQVRGQDVGAQTATRGQDIGADTATRGQDVQVRGQDVGAQTATRGQDVGAQTATRGQDVQVRGQDVGAQTATRGQDITQDTAVRGQDVGAQTATRGQDVQVRGQDVTVRGQDVQAATAAAEAKAKADALASDPKRNEAIETVETNYRKGLSHIDNLQEAVKILQHPNGIYTGAAQSAAPIAGGIPVIGGMLVDKEKAQRTARFNTIVGEDAIRDMATTLKGSSTNYEMGEFKKMKNDPNISDAARAAQLQKVVNAARIDLEATAKHAKAIGGDTGRVDKAMRDSKADAPADPNAEARKWLEANPTDPRAEAVRKKLEGK